MGGSLPPELHPECFSPFGIHTHGKIFWIANCILECNWLLNRELQTANCILELIAEGQLNSIEIGMIDYDFFFFLEMITLSLEVKFTHKMM